MRNPTGAELLLFARCLRHYPAQDRAAYARAILGEVAMADAHLRHTGTLHPFGDGSLMARCHQLSPSAEPLANDPDFVHCLQQVCAALLAHSRTR